MSIDSEVIKTHLTDLSWLRTVLLTLLLGPIFLFADFFPLWVVLGALVLLSVPWVLRAVRTRRLLPATAINIVLLPLLVVFLPLSMWVSPLFWEASWPKATSLLWATALFFSVVDAVPAGFTAMQRLGRMRILVLIFIALGCALTAVGLLALASAGSRLPAPAAVKELLPVLGEIVNPNDVGGIITLYLPLMVALWSASWAIPGQRSSKRFALWLLLALIFAAILLYSASFGALIGVIGGCGLVLLLLNRRTRLLLLPVGLMAVTGVLLIRGNPLLDQAIRLRWNNSMLTRLTIWQQALHSIQDFPLLGTGLGTFRFVAPVMYPLGDKLDLGHAHNLILQVVLDFGVPGALLFVVMWLILIAYLVRSLRQVGQTEVERLIRVLTIGFLGSLIAHAIFNIFDAQAPGSRHGFALWYLFGLSIAVGPPAVRDKRLAWGWRAAAAAAFLLLFATLIWFFWPMQRTSNATSHALLSGEASSEEMALEVRQTSEEQCRAFWHIGLMANAAGDVDGRDLVWQKLLACSDQYIDLMWHVAPEDRTLALAAVAQYPQDATGYFWLAALDEEQNPQAAIGYYEQGLALTPADGLRWVKLGIVREAAGDIDGAASAYDQGCFLVDQGKNGCLHAGRIHMGEGSYELAAERYRISIEQLPAWLPSKRGLAEALLAMGQNHEALPYLKILAENGDSWAETQLQKLMQNE